MSNHGQKLEGRAFELQRMTIVFAWKSWGKVEGYVGEVTWRDCCDLALQRRVKLIFLP